MRYGYARVSSSSQDYKAQVEALKSVKCDKVFSEKASAKNTKDRPEFNRLMKVIKPGDTVVVLRLDRLARSSRDLANIMHELQEKECGFLSLRESWCDTTNKFGRLLVTVMGGLNQFERELIAERCEEGIRRAKAMGTKFGRHNALDPGQRRKVAQLRAKGATVRELADDYGVGVATIMRALNGP
jgi:DNA invertase Pin-like site-specific DNA recombinase